MDTREQIQMINTDGQVTYWTPLDGRPWLKMRLFQASLALGVLGTFATINVAVTWHRDFTIINLLAAGIPAMTAGILLVLPTMIASAAGIAKAMLPLPGNALDVGPRKEEVAFRLLPYTLLAIVLAILIVATWFTTSSVRQVDLRLVAFASCIPGTGLVVGCLLIPAYSRLYQKSSTVSRFYQEDSTLGKKYQLRMPLVVHTNLFEPNVRTLFLMIEQALLYVAMLTIAFAGIGGVYGWGACTWYVQVTGVPLVDVYDALRIGLSASSVIVIIGAVIGILVGAQLFSHSHSIDSFTESMVTRRAYHRHLFIYGVLWAMPYALCVVTGAALSLLSFLNLFPPKACLCIAAMVLCAGLPASLILTTRRHKTLNRRAMKARSLRSGGSEQGPRCRRCGCFLQSERYEISCPECGWNATSRR